ncbi:MAG: H-NS histone family protein [Succinivibrio sp.]|nr:H-NS histone family protein [Succinivibrio sp.]
MDLKLLLNLRSLRSVLKNATYADLNKIIENLEQIKYEFQAREEEEQAKQAQREAKFQSVLANMNELGLTLEEFNAYTSQGESKGGKKPRRTMKPKYRYTALDGSVNEWTGQGKIPKLFKQLLDAEGRDKEYYRIQE